MILSHLGAHWISKGSPNLFFFFEQKKRKEKEHEINKTRSKKGVTRDMIFDSILDAKMTWDSSFGTIHVAI